MARRQASRKTSTAPSAAARRHPQATDHRLSPTELVDRLRHSKSAAIRTNAIRLLEKYLRRGDRFNATWEALGGARGTAALMAELSVADVRRLCARLGRTASATNARFERRAGLAELIAILGSGETDSRPLRKFYQSVVPASHDEVVQSWEKKLVEWTGLQESCLLRGHRELYEQRFLRDLFPEPPKQSSGFGQDVALFRGNLAFCERILNHMLALDADKVNMPHDFMSLFAMPLLNRFAKRRHSLRSELNKFLRLIVLCVQHHSRSFKDQLTIGHSLSYTSSDVLAFIITRWADDSYDGDRETLQSYMESLLPLVPSTLITFQDVYRALSLSRSHHPRYAQKRYELLLLILKYVERFRLDLESETSTALQRLKDVSFPTNRGHGFMPVVKDSWPVELFMFLPIDKSLALFDRLERTHEDESFVSCTGSGITILQQGQTPLSTNQSDIEIVRTVLQRKKGPIGSDRLDVVRLLVKERVKKATEAREPRNRSFWATSAINLCVATGDLDMVNSTFTWARRFIKDPLVCPEVFGRHTTMTRELTALFKAIPTPIDFDTSERLEEAISTAKHNIGPANKLIVGLTQTAISAVREPDFKAGNWSDIRKLPWKIAQQRTTGGKSICRLASEIGAPNPESIVAELIWKPTINLLLEIEVLMTDASASKLATGHAGAFFAAGSFMQELPTMEPQLQAEMTKFFLEAMRAQLPQSLIKSQFGFIVSAVSKLAHSSQPSLAIPFIRPLIENSEDSSSHRQLLTNGFLESLSAREVAEFLHSVAETMTDMMKAQNNRPWNESDSNQQPAIKVTTIKMLANLLNGSMVVDAATACGILVSLLREARHIDARIAIITSLLNTLEESTSTPALRSSILDIFEELVLPMASQLNERRPTTEEEWQGTEMPEISEESSILKLLVDKTTSKDLQAEDRARLIQISVRAVEQSAKNNQRWIAKFVDKHNFELRPNDLPIVGPAHFQPLATILRLGLGSLPETLFDMLKATILQNVDPSPGISHITSSIKADATLRTSNGGKFWLAQFDKSGEQAFSLGLGSLTDFIKAPAAAPQGQSRISDVSQLVAAVAERWIRQGKPEIVYRLVDHLVSRPYQQEARAVDWQNRCIDVLENMIHAADAIREEKGSTLTLPNTFRLRLSILGLTFWSQDKAPTTPQVLAFAEMVSGLVDQLVNRRRPYHSDFTTLRAQIIQHARADAEFAQAALSLVSLHEEGLTDDEPSLASYLLFELVAEGLKTVQVSKSKEVKEEVQRVVGKWTTCPAEDLRVMGQQLEIDLKKKNGWYTTERDVVMEDTW